MPLVAAAVCPQPPVLVPELAAGAAGELDDLRRACDEAVGRLLAVRPALLFVVGGAARAARYQPPLYGSFAPWGVPLEVRLGAGTGGEPLPLSLTVGVWLLNRATAGASLAEPVVAQAVATDAPVEACAAVGAGYAAQPVRVGLLVMGDGSACRTEKAPGYLDPRGADFDAAVCKALADADPAALLALDPVLAAELMVAGRAAWQVLAGAGRDAGLSGEVLYDAAPYGVNYTVAVWR